jgi:hypothetical protein
MARGLSIRLRAETCRSLAFGSIGAGYTAIGTAMENPVRALLLQNLTNATVWISFDGVHDHMPLMAQGYLMFDITSNRTQDTGWYLSEGDKLYCKQLGIPGSGSVYLTVWYGQ